MEHHARDVITACNELRKIGCRCVLDESVKREFMPSQLQCSNRVCVLQSGIEGTDDLEGDVEEYSKGHRISVVDMNKVRSQVGVAERGERKVRVAIWNFYGICSQRKQKEVAGVLVKNNIDVCAGQESWEKEDSKISVDGYKWFGKPRQGSSESRRGKGGVGFLVKECLASGVELIKDVT